MPGLQLLPFLSYWGKTNRWGGGGGVKSHPLPRLESIHKELRVRSNTFFYCEMTIYIPFMLFKSNHVWFEKYKSENKQSIQYLIIYRLFVNLGFNKAIYLLFYQNWFLLCKPLIYIYQCKREWEIWPPSWDESTIFYYLHSGTISSAIRSMIPWSVKIFLSLFITFRKNI